MRSFASSVITLFLVPAPLLNCDMAVGLQAAPASSQAVATASAEQAARGRLIQQVPQPEPGQTGRICEASTPASASPPRGTSSSDCGRPCMPDETRDAAGCCVRAAAETTAPVEATIGCTPGQSRSSDTAGHCCWAGQVWSNGCCIGRPIACPEHFVATREGCAPAACAPGLIRARDGLNCCWPGQAWSTERGQCVGAPTCPRGMTTPANGEETCVPAE
jgi:hypothetical protein